MPGRADGLPRYADMLAAIGAEPRLRILRLLLSVYPEGMVAGKIQARVAMPGSTLSHHLERLRHEGLVTVSRQRQYLRYTANARTLHELLAFLCAECCCRSGAVRFETLLEEPKRTSGSSGAQGSRRRRNEPTG